MTFSLPRDHSCHRRRGLYPHPNIFLKQTMSNNDLDQRSTYAVFHSLEEHWSKECTFDFDVKWSPEALCWIPPSTMKRQSSATERCPHLKKDKHQPHTKKYKLELILKVRQLRRTIMNVQAAPVHVNICVICWHLRLQNLYQTKILLTRNIFALESLFLS